MEGMKITKKRKTPNHKVGGVYKDWSDGFDDGKRWLVIGDEKTEGDEIFRLLDISDCWMDDTEYKSLEDMDKEWPDDVLVISEIILNED